MNKSINKAKDVELELSKFASKERAHVNLRFFKTGPGQYGFGDQFIGVTVPQTRSCANKYNQLPITECIKLLHSPIHEVRLSALFILIYKYHKGEVIDKAKIFEIYISNTKYINNWDLVDVSAGQIVGAHLENNVKDLLFKFAQSNSIWERRIAMIATFPYIRKQKNEDAFKIASILVHDPHDLIQKAVGWMLREIGKNSGEEIEEQFLKKHYKTMPRTMLRYAIERFSADKRRFYLRK